MLVSMLINIFDIVLVIKSTMLFDRGRLSTVSSWANESSNEKLRKHLRSVAVDGFVV